MARDASVAGKTPRELLQELTAADPSVSAPLALITENYQPARYAEIEITGAALAVSRAASQRLAASTGGEADRPC